MTVLTNDSTYWRAFEENQLTHSVAHYLMAVDHLRNELIRTGHGRGGFVDISREPPPGPVPSQERSRS